MAGFRYGDMLLMSKGEISSVFYFNETSVKNHRSFFFYSNIFDFRNMTLFDNIQRYLATTASKPCFTLYYSIGCSGPIFYVFVSDQYSYTI